MRKPLLIVVDDEPGMVKIVQSVAKKNGFDVRTASGGKEFQKIWNKTNPSVIVMDIIMPSIDGHELLQWLAERGCTTPILLMSGYDGKYICSAETLGKARGAPVVDTLHKPFRIDVLEAKLKQILGMISLWSDELSVNVDVLDADHKVLFQTFHRLRVLAKTDANMEALSKELADLYYYTDYHFKREEALMEACEYPNLPSHRKIHEEIVAKIKGFIHEAPVEPNLLLTNELVDYLENWLQGHIMESDKDYQDWMAGKDELIQITNCEFQEKYTIGGATVPNVA